MNSPGGEKRGKLDKSKFGGLMSALGHSDKGKSKNKKGKDDVGQEAETEEEEAKRLAELEKQMKEQGQLKIKGSMLGKVLDKEQVGQGRESYVVLVLLLFFVLFCYIFILYFLFFLPVIVQG